MENKIIIDYLKNLKENYLRQKKNERLAPRYKAKCLGAMEVLLILLGGLSRFECFEYKEVQVESKILFWTFKHSEIESHEEFILRKVDETLNNQ